MALPIVVQFNYTSAFGTTSIALAQSPAAYTALFQLNGTFGTSSPFGPGVLGAQQQRVTITSGGSDIGIFFHIVGLNQAGFTVSEFLTGGGVGSTVQSNLDYKTVISIQPSASSTAQTLATTASTVSAGTNGVGSTLWNIMNWHVTPTNIEASGIVTTGTVTWSVQYTYDDPNNLPPGVAFPAPFTHPTLANVTASLDGSINDPVTGVRFLISAGTGTLRGTIIQAGIGSP